MKRPAVDILIVTWNSGGHLEKCIRAIRQHTTAWPYRLRVLDNGSTDGTGRWLRKQKDVAVISNARNVGVTRATNQLLRTTRSNWVVRLGDDTNVTPNWLDGLWQAAQEDKKIGIVGCRGISPEGSIETSDGIPGPQSWMWNGAFERDRGQRSYRKKTELVCGCILVRREVFGTIGLYDETLSDIGEDTDFGLRSRLVGFSTFYDGSTVVVHHRLRRRRAGRSIRNLNAYRKKWGECLQFPLPDTHPQDRIQLKALRLLVRGQAALAVKILKNQKTHSLDLLKALAWVQMGKKARAALILENLTSFSARAEYILGVFKLQSGKLAAAGGHFERALGLSPAFGPAYAALFELSVRSQQLKKAESLLRQGAGYCRDQTILRWCQARLDYLQGRSQAAKDLFLQIPEAHTMNRNSNEWLYPEF